MKKILNKMCLIALIVSCYLFIFSKSDDYSQLKKNMYTDPCNSEEELRPCVNNLLLFSNGRDSLCNVFKIIYKKKYHYTMRMLNLKMPYSAEVIPRDSLFKALLSKEIVLFDFDQSGMFCPQVCKVIGFSDVTREEIKAFKRKNSRASN